MNTPQAERPAMRPQERPVMDRSAQLASAKARAAAIRDNIGDLDEGIDEFYVPASEIPVGWSYEWKRDIVAGQEQNAYRMALERTGWEPVPTSFHPNMMPPDSKAPNITRKGMMLMMRPAEITQEIKDRDYRRARDVVKSKEAQLNAAPPGTMERANQNSSLVKVKKGWEAVPVPAD